MVVTTDGAHQPCRGENASREQRREIGGREKGGKGITGVSRAHRHRDHFPDPGRDR